MNFRLLSRRSTNIATSMYRENSKNICLKIFVFWAVPLWPSTPLITSKVVLRHPSGKIDVQLCTMRKCCARVLSDFECNVVRHWVVKCNILRPLRIEMKLIFLLFLSAQRCLWHVLDILEFFQKRKSFPLFVLYFCILYFFCCVPMFIFTKFVFVHMSLCFLVLVLCFLVCLFVFLCLWRCLSWKLATPTQESLPYTFSVWFALLNMFQAQLVEVQTQRNAPN